MLAHCVCIAARPLPIAPASLGCDGGGDADLGLAHTRQYHRLCIRLHNGPCPLHSAASRTAWLAQDRQWRMLPLAAATYHQERRRHKHAARSCYLSCGTGHIGKLAPAPVPCW